MRPIPDGRRDGEKFDDAPAVLAWVLRRLDGRRKSVRVSVPDKEGTDRVIALFALLRAASSHAKAILAATRRGVAEAGIANLRAMLELWADFNLIFGDRTGSAQRLMYVAGGLALLAREPNPDTEDELARRFPAEYPVVKKRLSRNAFGHWSGKGRKAVVVQYCGAAFGRAYELLSWDVHPVLPGVLDVEFLDGDAGHFQMRHRLPQAEAARDNCILAAHIVRAMWNALASEFPGA